MVHAIPAQGSSRGNCNTLARPPVRNRQRSAPEADALAGARAERDSGLKLLGGSRSACCVPDFRPRLQAGQDMDFACLSKGRKHVVAYLESSGCGPDRRLRTT